jgi:hypothetical protein
MALALLVSTNSDYISYVADNDILLSQHTQKHMQEVA